MKLIDLTGQRFGMLTVVRRVPDPQKKKVLWECRCDCGKTCVRSSILLTHDISISCGCTRRGKQINLGSFPTMEEAVAARKDAEAKYFGAIIDQYEHQKKEDE